MLSFNEFNKTTTFLKENLEDFVHFACDHLALPEKPEIKLLQAREDNMTTANYCPNTKIIKIYAKGRALFDVARSLAHELVHHKQNINGETLDGSTGSDCENEANATAGKIIRLYGEKNPQFYE